MLEQVHAFWLRTFCFRPSPSLEDDHGDDHHGEDEDEHGDEDDREDSNPVRQLALHGREGQHLWFSNSIVIIISNMSDAK